MDPFCSDHHCHLFDPVTLSCYGGLTNRVKPRCCPESQNEKFPADFMNEIIEFITVLFKSMEWFFWCAVFVCAFHVVNIRCCYNSMIKFFNWMVRLHDFEGRIAGTPKAFDRYRRDMWILLVLNAAVIFLIRLI